MPSILGGGEVIADALVAGTPRIGVGVVTGVAVGFGVGEVVVDGCTAGGVTGFGGDTAGVDGAGAAVGLFVAIGCWQPNPPTSKTTTIASANNDFLGLIRSSSSPWSQPEA